MTTQQRSNAQSQPSVKSSQKRIDRSDSKSPQSSVGVHIHRRAPDATVPRSPSEHEVVRVRF
jgi:hypothetical protein